MKDTIVTKRKNHLETVDTGMGRAYRGIQKRRLSINYFNHCSYFLSYIFSYISAIVCNSLATFGYFLLFLVGVEPEPETRARPGTSFQPGDRTRAGAI